jgi:hypothetical protein
VALNFYLLKASALHDAFILERYVHGNKRDMRDERVRLRANEWHELRLEVRGDRISAFQDRQLIFEESGLVETVGGLGLWARVTTAACLSEARVEVL